jgi:acylphosphatase
MSSKPASANIIASGLVQGVGFRYFVLRKAVSLGLKGYVQNLFSGEVLTVAEGEKFLIEELFSIVKTGPPNASVNKCTIEWQEFKNEFDDFKVKY